MMQARTKPKDEDMIKMKDKDTSSQEGKQKNKTTNSRRLKIKKDDDEPTGSQEDNNNNKRKLHKNKRNIFAINDFDSDESDKKAKKLSLSKDKAQRMAKTEEVLEKDYEEIDSESKERKEMKMKKSERSKRSEVVSNDDSLPSRPLQPIIVPKNSALNSTLPYELVQLHLRLQKLKGTKQMSKENQEVLSQVAAKIDIDEEQELELKKLAEIKANSQRAHAGKVSTTNLQAEFATLKKIALSEVDEVALCSVTDFLHRTVNSVLSEALLKRLSSSFVGNIAAHLVRSIRREADSSTHLLFYVVLLNRLDLTIIKGGRQDEATWDSMAEHFFAFCENASPFPSPQALLASLLICVEQIVTKCTSADIEEYLIRTLSLYQSILHQMARRYEHFADSNAIAAMLFILSGTRTLSKHEPDEGLFVTSIAHTTISALLVQILDLCQLSALDSVFGKFSSLINCLTSEKSPKEALRIWLDLFKMLPNSVHKYKWHLLYLALNHKRISLPANLKTSEDAIRQFSQNIPRLNKATIKDRFIFNEVHHLVYVAHHLVKLAIGRQGQHKELLEFVKRFAQINPDQLSRPDIMMLDTMKKILSKN